MFYGNDILFSNCIHILKLGFITECIFLMLLLALFFAGETHSLKSLEAILSTGSPLKPQSYDYVYKHIKEDLLLGSITGTSLYFVVHIFQALYVHIFIACIKFLTLIIV